ncbi:hypothetical protein PF003_g20515 [Phytophthora fragariae]|nr:hypothetical protein PF003_g20515 [Phytophthora fragariae]
MSHHEVRPPGIQQPFITVKRFSMLGGNDSATREPGERRCASWSDTTPVAGSPSLHDNEGAIFYHVETILKRRGRSS